MTLTGHALRVEVRGKVLLDGVHLGLSGGELLAVVGPNGAGKSTLLRVLAGELTPSAGEVVLGGAPLAEWSPQQLALHRAVLRQRDEVAFAFRVRDVVAFGRGPNDDAGATAIVEAALATVQLPRAIWDRSVLTLSGGERQRVQLARVLAQVWEASPNDPRFLLLDEPTAALDLRHQDAVLAIARRWVDRGAGVLAVLHDLNLALRWADRVAVLHQGRLAAVGVAADALSDGVLHKVFGVSVARLRDPHTGTPLLVPLPPREDTPWSSAPATPSSSATTHASAPAMPPPSSASARRS